MIDYWSLIEPVWSPLNQSWDDGPNEFLRRFRSVRLEIRLLYAAHWCQSEVCNGGIWQFFYNSTGILAPEAFDAFKAIGPTECAEVLAEAMEFFGKPYPRDREDRIDRLPPHQRRKRKEWDPFYELDNRFYEWVDSWEELADAYAERAVSKEEN